MIRCYNLAISGGTSTSALTFVPEVVRLKPRACLIETQINDCSTNAAISTTMSTININSIIDQIRAGSPGTKMVLMTMSPVVGSGLMRSVEPALKCTTAFTAMWRLLKASISLISTRFGPERR